MSPQNPFDFVTNDSVIGQRLKAAASRYIDSRLAARGLSPADKMEAYRKAKRVYEAEIALIMASLPGNTIGDQ